MEHFMHHGGEKFAYVPCLNDRHEGMDVIQLWSSASCMGWVKPKGSP